MIISNITPPQVWSASSRSLTNFGSGALTPADTVFTALAASASVDFRTSAGIVGQMTVAVTTGGAATAAIQISIWDGTSAIQAAATAAAANSRVGFTAVNTNSVGPRITNLDGANAGSYINAQYLMTI